VNKYLAVNRLEFAVTYSCTGKCRHCYSTPKRQKFPGRISRSLAVKIVKKADEKRELESVMTFGGEPLLFPEIVFAIHKTAANLGIPVRNVITNGYWSDDPQKIKETAIELKKVGVNSIDISVDAFHQEYIPLEIVRKAAEACLEVGIESVSWDPCWVISKEHDNLYNRKTRLILKRLEDLPIRVSDGNVMEPLGLSLVNLREYLPPKEKMPEGSCGEMPYTIDLIPSNLFSLSLTVKSPFATTYTSETPPKLTLSNF
jgi:hypothetical protein